MFMIPPNASEPKRLDEGPFTTSICLILFTAILLRSKLPEFLPIRGTPSIKIVI